MDTLNATVRTERWFYEYGDYLYRYTRSRINDSHLSEDIVQQTFLTAFQYSSSFRGASTERTWLTGILRNKIRDNLRREAREPSANRALPIATTETSHRVTPNACVDEREQTISDHAFNPREQLEHEELWNTLLDCIAELPKKSQVAFVLRELEAEKPKTIAKRLSVSDNGYWLLLSRARSHLRVSLRRKMDASGSYTH